MLQHSPVVVVVVTIAAEARIERERKSERKGRESKRGKKERQIIKWRVHLCGTPKGEVKKKGAEK